MINRAIAADNRYIFLFVLLLSTLTFLLAQESVIVVCNFMNKFVIIPNILICIIMFT